jgi:hypothetical protein
LSKYVFAQSFEGEIIYANTYKSLIPGLSDEQLTKLLGSKEEYFISGGNYKTTSNGAVITMQLYDYKTNRLYNKTPKTDTLYWNDAAVNVDSVLSYEVKKNAAVILGYQCDEMILHTKGGTYAFYFTDKLPVDIAKFRNHHFGNWAFYTSKSKSLPLKSIVETNQFRMESTVLEVKPLKLSKDYFAVDAKTPVAKSR